MTITQNNCVDTKWNLFYEKIWIYLDAMIYSIIPFVLLSIFNGIIIRHLLNRKKKDVEKFCLENLSMLSIENIRSNSQYEFLHIYIDMAKSIAELLQIQNELKRFKFD
ncbi:hypothetical protein BpHYR1_019194 [Brachionus plicatilis]|uniref:Uncharacterized protein n=1 Tax=Brachionus plicatilis TaxID=10195 RepID=A0A3M7S690_BRAPC|nr:hypothetical protein BpHYR1_019194 [Brachionus plicatilis]